MMRYADVGETNPLQLQEISNWQNHAAWALFKERYEPLLRRCCRRFQLDAAASDEVCQETWIEVANRMTRYVYNPKQRIRGWLWRVCYHKAIDHLRNSKTNRAFTFDERDEPFEFREANMSLAQVEGEVPEADCEDPSEPSLASWQRQVEEIQSCVRRCVDPRTWEAFWLVDIAFWSVDEAVEHLKMSHAAIYAAKRRIERRLRDEGRNRNPPPDES